MGGKVAFILLILVLFTAISEIICAGTLYTTDSDGSPLTLLPDLDTEGSHIPLLRDLGQNAMFALKQRIYNYAAMMGFAPISLCCIV